MALKNDHRYPPLRLGRREPYLLNSCVGKTVLDLGFMDVGLTKEKVEAGALLHLWIKQAAKRLVGVDLDPSLRHLLPPDSDTYQLYFGNVEDPATFAPAKGVDFDVVIAAEIMEHVNNPGLFLDALRTVMSPTTTLVLTVPNGLRFQNIAYAHQGMEMVNPDHNYWFSPTTIQTLLNKNRFHVKALAGYIFGPEPREHLGPHGLACPGLMVEATPAMAGETPRRWQGNPPENMPLPGPPAATPAGAAGQGQGAPMPGIPAPGTVPGVGPAPAAAPAAGTSGGGAQPQVVPGVGGGRASGSMPAAVAQSHQQGAGGG